LARQKKLAVISLPLILFLSWSVFGFGIRNQLLSFFYFLILLKLIELASQNKLKWFLATPLLMLLWANSHGGFIIGVILLLAFLFEKTARLIMGHRQSQNYRLVLGTTVLAVGATLLNPFGLKLYLEDWRHFYTVPLAKLIAEWVPPNFPFLVLILLCLILGTLLLFKTRNRNLGLFKLIILLFLGLLAFQARRNLPFFFTFFASLLASLKKKPKFKKPIIWSLSFLGILTLFGVGFFFQLPKTLFVNSHWLRFCQDGQVNYPCQAVEFLKNQPKKGNIFNRYEWGGFLIWQLPENKVFVDGRMPAWPTPSGKSPYTIYLETLQTQPGWQKTLARYKIDWILINPGTFMDLKLKPDPRSFGWQEVYRDNQAVIYKKR
jgi:hypothetical protein